jgi:hypothetical protein
MGERERERVPTPEDAPIISVDIGAEDAPVVGARMSVDYVAQDGDRGIDVTWLAPDPAGTWVVTYVSRPDEQGRVMIFLENPARPDGPK